MLAEYIRNSSVEVDYLLVKFCNINVLSIGSALLGDAAQEPLAKAVHFVRGESEPALVARIGLPSLLWSALLQVLLEDEPRHS